MEVTKTNSSGVVDSTYLFTIIPATCETNLPLLSVTLLDTEAPGEIYQPAIAWHSAVT